MTSVLDLIQSNWKIILLVLLCILPFALIFRKKTVPMIMYIIEYAVYLCIIHAVMYFVVSLGSWFHEESQFRALSEPGQRAATGAWKVPTYEVWKQALYNPQWLMYVEIGFFIVALLLMFKFRPMKLQKVKTKSPMAGFKKRRNPVPRVQKKF